MTTGEVIKDLLEKKKRTQADLARHLTKCTGKEVSTNTVNRWIPNESNPNKKVYPPSNKYLPMIAEFFNVSISILLGEAGKWDSKYHLMFCADSIKRTEKYCQWLESLGYSLDNDSSKCDENGNTIIGAPDNITISWIEDDYREERTMKAVEFDMFMKHMEKLQRLEFEDYYQKWNDIKESE